MSKRLAAWALVWWAVPALAQPAPDASADAVRSEVRAWRKAHEKEILREYLELLAIPNLASDASNIGRNAERIAAMLERRGVKTRLLDGEGGPPVVYGELVAPGATRTIVLYAHYDGQPVDPAEWKTAPWKPVLRDGPLEAGGREIALESSGCRSRTTTTTSARRTRTSACRTCGTGSRRTRGC